MPFRKKLDRSRPFGSIHPPLEGGGHYEQDGIIFDHEGLVSEPHLTQEQRTALTAKEKSAPQQAATPGKPGSAKPSAEPEEPPQPPKESDDPEINLTAWLQGTEKYPEFAVKKAVRLRYSKACNTTEEIVEFLVEKENMLPAAQIAPQFQAMLKD